MTLVGVMSIRTLERFIEPPSVYVICNMMSVEPSNIVCRYVTDMI